MSGHSKWKTIQHKKGAADAKRGKIFSKMAKELMVVAKAGGGSPDTNTALRNLIIRCKASSMPNENIDRAIKKGTGELASEVMEDITYEGFAAGGVGVVVKVLTDNKNRAAAELRHIFSKNGSSLAAPGSVSRGFKRRGQIFVDAKSIEEDKLMDIVLNAGADDMSLDGEQYEILTDPNAFQGVFDALEKAGIKTDDSAIRLVPETYTAVSDKTVAKAVMKFVDTLEDNDDVQDVYTNMDLDDSVLALISAE
ncbi:MAG: YebC/PmpR family DNA-binding transcriptional regulator [bacterium]